MDLGSASEDLPSGVEADRAGSDTGLEPVADIDQWDRERVVR